MPKFKSEELLKFTERLLRSAGVAEDDARLTAKMLIQADLNGYAGHGIAHIPSYINRIKAGVMRLDERPKVIREGKTTALMDGKFYIGQVAAHEGMKLAIEKAREHGVGTVCLFHAGHVGRLADHVELAADQGMIGVAMVGVGGNSVASYGTMEPVGGTNPMAFGVPGKDRQHIIFDFATAALSSGELRQKAEKGEAIPEGMMLDGRGHPTTDFKTFLGPPKGVVLPFGGYKGSGLHLMVEILGGILAGNGLGREWWDRGGPAINAAFLQAIDIEEFQPLNEFLEKVDELVRFVKSRKAAPGFGEVLLPGDRSRARASKHLKEGIELKAKAWTELTRCASELGVKEIPKPV